MQGGFIVASRASHTMMKIARLEREYPAPDVKERQAHTEKDALRITAWAVSDGLSESECAVYDLYNFIVVAMLRRVRYAGGVGHDRDTRTVLGAAIEVDRRLGLLRRFLLEHRTMGTDVEPEVVHWLECADICERLGDDLARLGNTSLSPIAKDEKMNSLFDLVERTAIAVQEGEFGARQALRLEPEMMQAFNHVRWMISEREGASIDTHRDRLTGLETVHTDIIQLAHLLTGSL